MSDAERRDLALAAAAGFLSVAFGAFAAHGAHGKAADWLHTAGLYAGLHALAVIGCLALAARGLAGLGAARAAFLVGILVFSGSLVAMAFGAPRWFGAITPIGGLAFLAGWGLLAVSALRKPSAP